MRQGTSAGFGSRGGRLEREELEVESLRMFEGERDMSKVRVKLRYQGDTRGMVSRCSLSLGVCFLPSASQGQADRERLRF